MPPERSTFTALFTFTYSRTSWTDLKRHWDPKSVLSDIVLLSVPSNLTTLMLTLFWSDNR